MNALEDLRTLNGLPPDSFWLSANSVPPLRHTRSACCVNGPRPRGTRPFPTVSGGSPFPHTRHHRESDGAV